MPKMKRKRLDRGIGLRELARRLQVSPAALLRWEAGTRNPTPEHLRAWRRALR